MATVHAEMKNTYEATDRHIDANGIDIHYNEAGTGPALFCFHGGGPGANAWDNTKHNFDAFAEHFQTILMDMPGYGYSDKKVEPAQGESLDRFWARCVKDVMDAKGIQKTSLFGSSQSGPAVLRFGLEYPERTHKIILQSSSPGGGNMFTPSPPEGIVALGTYANNPTRENMEHMMHLFIPKAELCTDEMIEARFKAAQIPGHLEARARNSAGRNSDMRMEIRNLKAPVLVVWGHQDKMVPWEGAITCLQMIPDVRIHVWGGGSGHFVEYEHADEFSRLVIDFLTH